MKIYYLMTMVNGKEFKSKVYENYSETKVLQANEAVIKFFKPNLAYIQFDTETGSVTVHPKNVLSIELIKI